MCASATIQAGYKDDIGHTQLVLEQGVNTPDGAGIPVTLAEAPGANGAYWPNLENTQFSGKTIDPVNGVTAGIYSAHANLVAEAFFGNTSSIAPGISTVDAYDANEWIQGSYLSFGGLKPLFSSTRVANHSWIASELTAGQISELLRRMDWVIDTDEFIQCVGINNGSGSPPPVMSAAYNVIAVGRSDGEHTEGTEAVDGDYVLGRTRPELVAPKNKTSYATPVVAASAALLIEHGQNNPGLSTDPNELSSSNRYGDTVYNTGRSEVIKAVLMAGADRSTSNSSEPDITDYRSDEVNLADNGLDKRFGAGQVNIYNSFYILNAGEQNSDEDIGTGDISAEGFDYDPSFGGLDGSNATASYYFSTAQTQEKLFATLAWNISIDDGAGESFTGAALLYDLDLELYDITTDVVLLDSSVSSIDNTESLWLTLSPDRDYLLQVIPKAGQTEFNWDYALAWRLVETDEIPPRVLNIDSDMDTGDGVLTEDESVGVAITQLLLTFNEAMSDPAGNSEAGDVTNPANYLLVEAGTNGGFDTLDCMGGLQGDDVGIDVNGVTYSSVLKVVNLSINAGTPLGTGDYRLFACGSTSLQDLFGNSLDGDGNGTGGDDFMRSFSVRDTDEDGDPDFSDPDDDDDGILDDVDYSPLIKSNICSGENAEVAAIIDDARQCAAPGSVTIKGTVAVTGTWAISLCSAPASCWPSL